MTVAELIGELRAYPLDAKVSSLAVTVKVKGMSSKLMYSDRVAKRLSKGQP